MDVDEFLNVIIPIKDPSLRSVIQKAAKIETIRPQHILSNMGERENTVKFLISGAIWGHMYNTAGQDVTICFITNPGEVICGSEYLGAGASEITLSTITECEIFSIPLDVLLELRLRYHEIEDLYLQTII